MEILGSVLLQTEFHWALVIHQHFVISGEKKSSTPNQHSPNQGPGQRPQGHVLSASAQEELMVQH